MNLREFSTPYRVVTQDDASIPIGEIVYYQTGSYGTPKGLLLSLTNTPNYVPRIKTINGLRKIIWPIQVSL